MADNHLVTSTSPPGKPVPFVGWSRAAARFREVVTTHAAGGKSSVLIVGPAGAGKKPMAQVWQHLAGQDHPRVPIVNLDLHGATIPDPCIAISTWALPRNKQWLRLDNGKHELPRAEPTNSDVLSEQVVDRFPASLRLYMPALRERPMDILALLHFFNLYVLPKRVGGSYDSISQVLLAKILKAPWDGNALDLQTSLIDSAGRDASRLGRSATSSIIRLGNLRATASLDDVRKPNADPSLQMKQRQLDIIKAIERGDLPDTSERRHEATSEHPHISARTFER